ncbi:hypothetical protein LZP69_13185 [Shewanella sp. AS1]|uniref:hypothetical protein n=1 Tax=Shewanella sp. AS1 TaxID=2907626 RepID=UPI001F381128|nr:hypothetical protein [Shewanella sp. AS1]MCE9680118.1 hypothetical protein [Shewanella sp. AS1]
MIYHQFQRTPFQNRFSGSRGWLAFAIGLGVMTLVLLALPFVLLIGAISFILLSLFGRVYLKRQLAKFRRQTQAPFAEQFTEADSIVKETPFSRASQPRQGRTFEHDPQG